MQQEQMEVRKQRGYEIAKTSRIEKTDKGLESAFTKRWWSLHCG